MRVHLGDASLRCGGGKAVLVVDVLLLDMAAVGRCFLTKPTKPCAGKRGRLKGDFHLREVEERFPELPLLCWLEREAMESRLELRIVADEEKRLRGEVSFNEATFRTSRSKIKDWYVLNKYMYILRSKEQIIILLVRTTIHSRNELFQQLLTVKRKFCLN